MNVSKTPSTRSASLLPFSTDYKQPVPKDLQDLFVDACKQIRRHFP